MDNKSIVERIFSEGMNKRNSAVIYELIAPNYVNHSMPTPMPGPEGLEAVVKQFFSAFPDMLIHLDMVVSDGDLVATSGYWTGTNQGEFMGMPATGKKVNIRFMDFWKIKDGKAVENWVQMDNAAIMQQLGQVPQMA